jgi:hypothetical protein
MERFNFVKIGLLLLVCIFGIAKAQTPIQPPEGMVSWWTGDGHANDIVGGNDGISGDDVTFENGMVGGAFCFDGTGDEAVVWAPGVGIDGLPQLTIDAWVKLYSMEEDEERFVTLCDNVLLRHDGFCGFRQLHFCINFGGEYPYHDLHHIRVDGALQSGEFYHVAGTYDGAYMRLYLDGVEVGHEAVTKTIHATGRDVGLSWPDEPMDGLLDEVEVYDRALSADEIWSLFEAGSAGKCKVAIPVILNFFDESVADGSLVGEGPGKSAENRLNALRNMLETAGNLIDAGDYQAACGQLMAVYKKTDGDPKAPDFVSGPAAIELAIMILDLMDNLGCQ